MKVLGIETATRAGGAALLEDGELVSEKFGVENATHSRRLLPAIDALLKDAGWKPTDIDLVAVSVGPGSFTGLRIGMAVAKGFAMSAGAELIGVPTLEALAHQVAGVGMGLPMWAIIDARKSQVFAAPFDDNGARLAPDVNLKPEELAGRLAGAGRIILAGDGIRLYETMFAKALGGDMARVPEELDDPRPGSVAALGHSLYARGFRNDLDTSVPLYVRDPDAVLNPRPAKTIVNPGTDKP